jgi:hypothetical protein
MDAEIVLDQNDGLGVSEVDVGRVFQNAAAARSFARYGGLGANNKTAKNLPEWLTG